jgi:hypothetical protein
MVSGVTVTVFSFASSMQRMNMHLEVFMGIVDSVGGRKFVTSLAGTVSTRVTRSNLVEVATTEHIWESYLRPASNGVDA